MVDKSHETPVAPDAATATELDELFSESQHTPGPELTGAIWRDQRSRWQTGHPVPVEKYIERLPNNVADSVLVDLIYGEYVARSSIGETPSAPEYASRFPELAAQLERQFSLESTLVSGDTQIDQPTLVPGSTPADQSTLVPGGHQEIQSTLVSSRAQQDPSRLPERVGKYRVVSQLGAGGQAVVYRAIHPTLERDVVIKLSKQKLESDGLGVRFLSEGRILAELEHPHIARIFDCDMDNGRPFLVMEYLPARDLSQYVTNSSFSLREAATLTAAVARAVAVAHRRGISHLDIKPQNILVDEQQQPHLIDFGLACLADGWRQDEKLGFAGTLEYMAPEQAHGSDQIGPSSDIFALGGVLYFLLVGKPPYAAANIPELVRQIEHGAWNAEALDSAEVPRSLGDVCRNALAVDPSSRYRSADELADDLDRFLSQAGRQWRTFTIAAAATVISISVLGLWALNSRFASDSVPAEQVANGSAADAAGAPPEPVTSVPLRDLLQIQVWSDDRRRPLVDALPIFAGDEFHISVRVPGDLQASLFAFHTDQSLDQLDSLKGAVRVLQFPAAGQTVPLEGPAGTTIIFVCARPASTVSLADVQATFDDVPALPQLPDLALFRLCVDGVVVEQQDRAFGRPVSRQDPEGTVQRWLEELHERFSAEFSYFEALAFGHPESLTQEQ